MAGSQAETVRKALQGMGLIDENKKPGTNEVLSRQRAEAARKSHEVRKAKKLAEQIAKGITPLQNDEIAKSPVVARDSSKTTVEKEAKNAQGLGNNFAISAANAPEVANMQNLQTVQQANVANARKILNDAAGMAAKYLSDLVSGAIPDAPERLRLEAAKVILQSQGVTGEQQSANSRQDANTMSKDDLMAFIKAGTVELERLKAARETDIIDVTPNESD